MYKFVDTIEAADLTVALQDEAVNINGIFLDNVISGFITTSVSGRDSASYDINSEEKATGGYGNSYFGKRLNERILVINFKLTASSASDLIDKFNQLKGYLTDEDLIIKFNDNLEWEYRGTLSEIANPPEGTLIFISSFEITCSDPLAHAINPKGPFEATLDDEGRYFVEVDNKGTVDAPITVTATMNSENGFIGMYTDYGVTEIGLKEEVDGNVVPKSEMLLDSTNFSEFTPYTGVNPENPNKLNNGALSYINQSGYNLLKLTSPGTGSGWHGGAVVYTLPADSNGVVGAEWFNTKSRGVFWAGLNGQSGQIQVLYLTSDNKLIMGYSIAKDDLSGNDARVVFHYSDGKGGTNYEAGRQKFTASHINSENPFNLNQGNIDMRKEGSLLRFFSQKGVIQATVPALNDVKVAKVMICVYQYGSLGGNKFMSWAGMRSTNFFKNNVEGWDNVPNRFSERTVVKMTGKDGKVYVNEILALTEKVAGSNLFTVPPGKTKIYFEASSWVSEFPKIEVEFEEVSV